MWRKCSIERRKPSTKTLDKGVALFESEVEKHSGIISWEFAFRLYDEQGFPLDLTALMARECGLTVDNDGFDKLMEARARPRPLGAEESGDRASPRSGQRNRQDLWGMTSSPFRSGCLRC